MTGELSGLRVLVLGAGALHEPAFLSWARHGCRTTLVDGEESMGYEPLVDTYLPLQVYDGQVTELDELVALASRHDVVLTLSEMAQMTTAAVAQRAGRRGAGVEAARLARDKFRQRELAAGAGLPTVRCVRIDDAGGLDAVPGSVPPPWVVKPVDSGGSAAVSLVTDREGLAAACARAQAQSMSGRCVVEEFVPGPEWSVELLVTGGEVRFTSPTDKTLVAPDCFVERRHVVGATLRPPLWDEIQRTVRRMVRLYQVDTALCHLEVRVGGGRVTPIEMAVRPAGDGLVELVRLVHGRDLYAELVAALAGRTVTPRPAVARYAGVEFLVATGTVTGTPRPADVVDHRAGVRYAVPALAEGETVPALDANWSRAGRAVAVGDSQAALERALDGALDAMSGAMGVKRW